MMFDTSTRRLVGLLEELAAGDDSYIDDVLELTVATPQRSAWTFLGRRLPGALGLARTPSPSRRWTTALVLVTILGLVVASAAYVASRRPSVLPTGVVSNGWIAFATMPGDHQIGSTDFRTGGDLFLALEGRETRLVSGRLDGVARNVCPSFSPDGTRLAYGTVRNPDRAVVVVGVTPNGGLKERSRTWIDAPGSAPSDAPCPRWSADGQRIAYLDAGAVVVRRLDGATVAWSDGDPRIEQFVVSRDGRQPLLSPAGDRIVRVEQDCHVIVSAPDGTSPHAVPDLCPYEIATWSPDGRRLLVMLDLTGHHFAVVAVSVDAPFDRVTIAGMIPTNGGRSWPGRGDVAWQPVFE